MIVVVDETLKVRKSSKSATAIGITGRGDDLPDAFVQVVREAIASYLAGSWTDEGLIETRLDDRILQFSVTPSVLSVLSKASRDPKRRFHIATIAARDVTCMREQEERVAYLSRHDERTGALRRSEFLRLLQIHIEAHGDVAIFAFNLHRFKTINTTLGRDVGDLLLEHAVRRLGEEVPGVSQIVRLDGDSFAVFATDPLDLVSPLELAERIHQSVAAPYDLNDARARLSARGSGSSARRIRIAFRRTDCSSWPRRRWTKRGNSVARAS